jgi:DnaJ homologue, subfamily C, member 28, conserved domain
VDLAASVAERRIAEAMARGELDGGRLKGKPIVDLDEQRPPGWWAERFVREERLRLDREEAVAAEVVRAWRADRRSR